VLLFLLVTLEGESATKRVGYIHGDVSAKGAIPSAAAAPYDQMLLTDTGNNGLSIFKTLIEGEGYTISQVYDGSLTMDAAFLNQYDVIIFGLHQRVWTEAEQAALDVWIRAGGGILMYSDSAAGGFFSEVGIKNQTGQRAVNSILSNYGMQVTVDQAGGTRGYRAAEGKSNPIIWDRAVFEGEGVSPVAIDPAGDAVALIPLDDASKVSGGGLTIDAVGVTIANPVWAVMGHSQVDRGNVIAIFDRQPFWNNGPGSDINEEDNKEILRRMVRFLARDYGNSAEWLDFKVLSDDPADFRVSYRQWANGGGTDGFDYTARNNRFTMQQQENLADAGWRIEASLVEEVSSSPFGDDESETVTVRLLPDATGGKWFARVALLPEVNVVVDAGADRWIRTGGTAKLEGTTENADNHTWMKSSGPGSVAFSDPHAPVTSATFSAAGTYVLELSVTEGGLVSSDTLTVTVVPEADLQIAINCGGANYSAQTGFPYVADVHFDGGGIDSFPGNAVSGTDDDALYNTARSKPGFTGYSIPVPNGSYLVLLQLSETFFTADNARVFDVSIEGTLVLDDIDLHATSGGKWVAIERSHNTNVIDSTLNINVQSSVNNPLINGIVVISQP
jgi:hypothetical protein